MWKIIKKILGMGLEENPTKRILIIDSSSVTVKFLCLALNRKFLLTIAQDKEDALNKSKIGNIDLIILKSRLNKERTLNLCFSLKNNEKTKSIPILIIAKDDDSNITEFFAQGIGGYLIEPFSKKDILAQVQTVLNSGKE